MDNKYFERKQGTIEVDIKPGSVCYKGYCKGKDGFKEQMARLKAQNEK